MSRRILLYSHDAVGLGHIRRVTAIARMLADEQPESSILILTGSSVADAHPLPVNVDIVKLPSVRKVRNSLYASRSLNVSRTQVLGLRRALIEETFHHFDPDLLIVDKLPLGVHDELLPIVQTARSSSKCEVVLSLRDILDTPEEIARSWAKENTVEAIRDYYDRVLVWGMPEIYDIVSEYHLPADIAAKVEYCGYIASNGSTPDTNRDKNADKKLVLATVGGGEDGCFLLEEFLRALPRTTERFASVVLCGPHLPEACKSELRDLVARADRPVFLVDFTKHIRRLLHAADLVVSMGGYNTVCEIVHSGKRAIIVPRTTPREEQLLRAERLDSLGVVRMIHPDTLNETVLAKAIDEELTHSRPLPKNVLDFGGLERARRILVNGSGHDFEPHFAEGAAS